MCAQPSAILYISVMDLMMTTWLAETFCLFDTFMVIKEYCCAEVLSFIYHYWTHRPTSVEHFKVSNWYLPSVTYTAVGVSWMEINGRFLNRRQYHLGLYKSGEFFESLTLNISSLARQRCLSSWGPRRTPWFFL